MFGVELEDTLASMGPRSHERGNPEFNRHWDHLGPRLQWGRVLMNAETTRMTYHELAKWLLQWGRVLMNAETNYR